MFPYRVLITDTKKIELDPVSTAERKRNAGNQALSVEFETTRASLIAEENQYSGQTGEVAVRLAIDDRRRRRHHSQSHTVARPATDASRASPPGYGSSRSARCSRNLIIAALEATSIFAPRT